MTVKNTFFDSVGGIAAGEGIVHIEMTQRSDLNEQKKDASNFEVSERLTMSINTFLRMYQSMGRVVEQLEEKKVIQKREKKVN